MSTLTLSDLAIVDFPYGRGAKAYVFGWQFGASLLVVADSLESAIHKWDEIRGRRVDIEADALDLADYGATTGEAIERAMSDGEIRINDGGTMVWVDRYEWMREFPTVREAGQFFRSC